MVDQRESKKPLMQHLKNKLLIVSIFVVAIIGLADASYLTYEHYTGNKVVCTITHGCEQVLTSQYATVFGIPISLGGIVFYLTILAFAFHVLYNPLRHRATQLLLGFTAIGLLSSMVLTGLQAFVIHSWCQFCLLSAMSSTILFVLSIITYKKSVKSKGESKNEQN